MKMKAGDDRKSVEEDLQITILLPRELPRRDLRNGESPSRVLSMIDHTQRFVHGNLTKSQ